MSASHDPKQPRTFLYPSFYELYRRESGSPGDAPLTGKVLRTNDPRWISPSENQQLSDWTHSEYENSPKKRMAKTLHELRQARKKLNFMIAEMDELIKRSS
jgi:hypothetical protein